MRPAKAGWLIERPIWGGQAGESVTLPDITVALREGDVLALEMYVKGDKEIKIALTRYDVQKIVQFPGEEPDALSPVGLQPLQGRLLAPGPNRRWLIYGNMRS